MIVTRDSQIIVLFIVFHPLFFFQLVANKALKMGGGRAGEGEGAGECNVKSFIMVVNLHTHC